MVNASRLARQARVQPEAHQTSPSSPISLNELISRLQNPGKELSKAFARLSDVARRLTRKPGPSFRLGRQGESAVTLGREGAKSREAN